MGRSHSRPLARSSIAVCGPNAVSTRRKCFFQAVYSGNGGNAVAGDLPTTVIVTVFDVTVTNGCSGGSGRWLGQVGNREWYGLHVTES